MSTATPSTIVIGLGKTGYSCARYLAAKGVDFMVVDTRDAPPYLEQLTQELPEIVVQLGELNADLLCQANELIVSPGLAVDQPAIAEAIAAGAQIASDIDLFCDAVSAPIVAITGSNAKSTVTTLVGLMAQQAGKNVGVGGNLGTPVLELLEEDEKELYVLELSSFQLEITNRLNAEVATVLNVSPDHLDRYNNSLDAYRAAKQRVFLGCNQVVENGDESSFHPTLSSEQQLWRFGLTQPAKDKDFGLLQEGKTRYLAQGEDKLLSVDELKIKGRHNVSNALAALALGAAVGLPMPAMLATLREFAGLSHRCQWVAEVDGVTYYNDSKGTNVGATVAALDGLGNIGSGRIVLIAGGDGKGADFADLKRPVQLFCRAVVLIGKDAESLSETLSPVFNTARPLNIGVSRSVIKVDTLEQAVLSARQLARSGDAVLLSPACASLDMFKNFEERGDVFMNAVRAL